MALRLVRTVALLAAHIVAAAPVFATCEIGDDPQAMPGGHTMVGAKTATGVQARQLDAYEIIRDPSTGRIAGVRDPSGAIHMLEFGPLSKALVSGEVPASGTRLGKTLPGAAVDLVDPCGTTNNSVTLDIPTLPRITVTGDRVKQPDFWVPVVQTLMPNSDGGGGGGVPLPPADKIERCKKDANDCLERNKDNAAKVGLICDDAAKQIQVKKPGWDVLISVLARLACVVARDLTHDGANNVCFSKYNSCLNGG